MANAASDIKDIEKLDAASILAIDISKPELYFPPDIDDIKGLYRRMAKHWHPNYNKDADAPDVFAHLALLKKAALEKIEQRTWQEPGYFSCRLTNGKMFRAKADAERSFDLGKLYIGPTAATFVVRKEYAALFQNAKQVIGKLRFENNKMRDIYAAHLPTQTKFYESDDAYIFVARKGKGEVLLRDLLPSVASQKRPDCHAAWIISRLTEMARYLDYTGISHNAITLDTVFVSPAEHTISLLGGWWYATPVGDALAYAPFEALDFLPDTGGKSIVANPRLDLEMVKAAGREILGDRGGTRLRMLKPAPAPMIQYLRTPTSGDAQKDLSDWYQKILPDSFGPRRFTELKVTYSDIYQPGG